MMRSHTVTGLHIHPASGAEFETTTRSLTDCVTMSIDMSGSTVTWFLEFGTLDQAAEQLRQAAAALEGLELAERNRRKAAAVRRLRESVEVSA